MKPITIYKQDIGGFLYVFDFQYHPKIVEFCRKIKDEYTRDEFAWDPDTKKWRFSNLKIVDEILMQYPEAIVLKDMYEDMLQFEAQKEAKIAETKRFFAFNIRDLPRTGLRDYQIEAIDKILEAIKRGVEGNYLTVLPTGAGKSIVISYLVHTLNTPVLILQPTKEILKQNYEKLSRYVDPSEIGIYSASMNEKTIKFFTFATIQSIYKKPEKFTHFKLVIIDEAHLVNPTNLSGMFTSFLEEIGKPKVIGCTATPYRLSSMYVVRKNGELDSVTTIKLINRIKGRFWSQLLYNIDVQTLINRGYLCPLKYIDRSLVEQSDIPLNVSRSEFDLDRYEEMIAGKISLIFQAIEYAKAISKSVLVFCSSVRQAEELSGTTKDSAVVSAKTPGEERDKIIKDFREGRIKVVFNVSVLTVGFDHPALDCVLLLRPTRSITLYYQMLGRGLRISPGKQFCTIIDMTSTVKNIGRVETIRLEFKEGKWELLSETGSWHNKELYSFSTGKKEAKPKDDDDEVMKLL